MTSPFLMRRWAKRVLAHDPQTLTLFRSGANGLGDAWIGLLTGWDGARLRIARKWRSAGDDAEKISQPGAYPHVDLAVADPIAAILSAPGFAEFADFFDVPNPVERSLVSAYTQALLYSLVRNLRPDNVIEIGTYRASTSKAICRALHANGHGFLHTVDPFNTGSIMRLIRRWPAGLRDRLCYYPLSSMEFFNIALHRGLTSDLIFVDGNHDYEYALFDIHSAARLLRPGGFIAVDNISQGGPVYAARDFIGVHPAWRECGRSLEHPPLGKAFDPERSTIAETDLCVIRAPARRIIGPRLMTIGQQKVAEPRIGGIELSIASPASGALHAQYVVRVREPRMSETTTETSIELRDAMGSTQVPLPWAFALEDVALERTIELWLSWTGDGELELSEPPALF